MLIAIEGPDGCGKSTVARRVAAHVHARLIAFPDRQTAVSGPAIDAYLKGQWRVEGAASGSPDLSALAFQALQVMNKAEWTPALAVAAPSPRVHVVLERYWQSAWVYGQIDGLPHELLERTSVCLPPAAAQILLDVPVDVALARRAARDGTAGERYEARADLVARAVKLYRELWALRPFHPNWHVIDATRPIDDVVAEVCHVLGV